MNSIKNKLTKSYGCLIAGLLVIFTLFNQCTIHTEDKINKPIIKVGDYEVPGTDFFAKLQYLSIHTQNESPDRILMALLDNYIGAGTLINFAKMEGYHKSKYFAKLMNDYIGQLKVEYSRNKRFEGQPIPDYLKNGTVVNYQNNIVVDYIKVPKFHKNIALKLKVIFDNGGNISNILSSPDFNEWHNLGIATYEKTDIESIPLTKKVLDKVFKMEEGDIQLIETRSGYHIIKMLSKLESIKRNGIRREKWIDNLISKFKIAYSRENGSNIFDDDELRRMIEIDTQTLDRIDFSINPLPNIADTKIVAQLKGQEISEEELISLVYHLPQKIQALFRNRSTRVKAVTALIILRCGGVKGSRNKDADSVEIKTRNIQSFLASELVKDKGLDTITILTQWLNNIESQEKLGTLYTEKSDEVPYSSACHIDYITSCNQGLSMKLDHYKSNSNFWLHPEKYCRINDLMLNFALLEDIEFSDVLSPKGDKVLASCKNWVLRVSDFEEVLNSLTPYSRTELCKVGNSVTAIHYLAQKSLNTKTLKDIIINFDILDNVDVIGNSIDDLNKFISEEKIIGKLDTITLSVCDLRSSGLFDVEYSNKFDSPDKRMKAIEEILVNKYWISQLDVKEFESDLIYQKKIKDYDNYQLAKMFYDSKFFVESVIKDDPNIDFSLKKAIINLNSERLNLFLHNIGNQINIEIDKEQFSGIDIAKSSYAELIHFMY